jgi:PEP-CTERM motif
MAIVVVPEPAGAILSAIGMLGLFALRRRKSRARPVREK